MKYTLLFLVLWLLLALVGCAVFFFSPAQAASVVFAPQEPKPSYSRIVEVDGVKMVLLPDGRTIPFGQSTICTDNCVTPEIRQGRSRLWLLAIPAGIVTVIALWPNSPPSVIAPPIPTLPPPFTMPPSADVPEPMTLALLGIGLIGLCAAIRKRVDHE